MTREPVVHSDFIPRTVELLGPEGTGPLRPSLLICSFHYKDIRAWEDGPLWLCHTNGRLMASSGASHSDLKGL